MLSVEKTIIKVNSALMRKSLLQSVVDTLDDALDALLRRPIAQPGLASRWRDIRPNV
jgi:hypothetical protein